MKALFCVTVVTEQIQDEVHVLLMCRGTDTRR
jgi:hypothetical protein